MSTRLRSWFIRFLLLVLVTVISTTVAGAPSTNDERRAMQVLSEYAAGDSARADTMLSRAGYQPEVASEVWERFPAIRKIEVAWNAAEQGTPGGGARLLAMMSRDLANSYDGVKHEPSLRGYLAMSPERSIDFGAVPAVAVPDSRPPPAVRRAIATIAQYVDGGTLGSVHDVMTVYAGLSWEQAYDVARTSKSNEEALLRAFGAIPREESTSRLRRFAGVLGKLYPSLRYEEGLGWLWGPPGEPPPPPPTPPSPPRRPGPPGGPDTGGPSPGGPGFNGPGPGATGPDGPGPGGGSAADPLPAAAAGRGGPGFPGEAETVAFENAARYRQLMRETYAESGRVPLFDVMIEGLSGFGGVVFGNDVRSSLPDAISNVEYKREQRDPAGALLVHLRGGRTLVYSGVTDELILAAHRIAYVGSAELGPAERGTGVGLVSLTMAPQVDSLLCRRNSGTSGVVVHPALESATFEVVVHPALEGMDLGWSALVVDGAPIEPNYIISRAHDLGDRVLEDSVRRLFDDMKYGEDGTWKVVDVPMTVLADGDAIVMQRDGAAFPAALRSTAFIEMRTIGLDPMKALLFFGSRFMDGSDAGAPDPKALDAMSRVDDAFAARFYRLVPALTRAMYDYDRINRFAAVLALLRLAKSEGASFSSPHLAQPSKHVPRAVRIDDDGIVPSLAVSYEDRKTEAVLAMKACRKNKDYSPSDDRRAREMTIALQKPDTHTPRTSIERDTVRTLLAPNDLVNAAAILPIPVTNTSLRQTVTTWWVAVSVTLCALVGGWVLIRRKRGL
jgi:hypothetical protein